MKIVEVSCNNCGKPIYVLGDSVRNKMFCTLGCMEFYEKTHGKMLKQSIKI